MPLPDPRPMTPDEFLLLQDRLDGINAHADEAGAQFSQANARELLGYVNLLYAAILMDVTIVEVTQAESEVSA